MVFQDPIGALNPRQTIYEAVAEGLRIQKLAGRRGRRVADALAGPGCGRPSASCSSTRTSSRAASGSGS